MGVKVKERPKGSGIWWIFINHKGYRKAKKIGGDKRLAIEVSRKIEARLVLGDLNLEDKKGQVPLFKEYSEIWLNDYIKAFRRPST